MKDENKLILIYGRKNNTNQSQNHLTNIKTDLPSLKQSKFLDLSHNEKHLEEEEQDFIDPEVLMVSKEPRRNSMPRIINTSNTHKITSENDLPKLKLSKYSRYSQNSASELDDIEGKENQNVRMTFTRDTISPVVPITIAEKVTDIKSSEILTKIFSKNYNSEKSENQSKYAIRGKKKRNIVDEIKMAISRKASKEKLDSNNINKTNIMKFIQLSNGIMNSNLNSKNPKSINEHGLVKFMVSKKK